MKLVVDTNVLFGFFWEGSITRKLILNSSVELICPETALEEIKKYSEEIRRKTGLRKEDFQKILNELKETVNFIGKKEYSSFLKEAKQISPDEADKSFFALCLKFSCFLWTNDSVLKNQDGVEIVSTKDIIEFLF